MRASCPLLLLHTLVQAFKTSRLLACHQVLAQLTIPMARNFSAAQKDLENGGAINRTGYLYEELLLDLDGLLATDSAFLLGPWLESARRLGGDATDCTGTVVGVSIS